MKRAAGNEGKTGHQSYKEGRCTPPAWLQRLWPEPQSQLQLPRSTLLFFLADPTAEAVLERKDCLGSDGVVSIKCPRTKLWVVLSTGNLDGDVWRLKKLLKTTGVAEEFLPLLVKKELERNRGPLWHNWATLFDDKGYFWELPRPDRLLPGNVEQYLRGENIVKGCLEMANICDPSDTPFETQLATGPARLADKTNALRPEVYQNEAGDWIVWWQRPGDVVLAYGIDEFVRLNPEVHTESNSPAKKLDRSRFSSLG